MTPAKIHLFEGDTLTKGKKWKTLLEVTNQSYGLLELLHSFLRRHCSWVGHTRDKISIYDFGKVLRDRSWITKLQKLFGKTREVRCIHCVTAKFRHVPVSFGSQVKTGGGRTKRVGSVDLGKDISKRNH